MIYILKKEINFTENFELGIARITKIIEFIKCGKLNITLEELHKLCIQAKIDAGMILEEENLPEEAAPQVENPTLSEETALQ